MDELLRDFIIETNQNLEEAATQLVLFERDPSDASLIASIFRLVHTIKGTCSFLGLSRLQHVAHAAENVIGELRNGRPPTQNVVSLILAAIDRIKLIVEEVDRSGAEPEGDDAVLIADLTAAEAALTGASVPPPDPAHGGEADDETPAASTKSEKKKRSKTKSADAAQSSEDAPADSADDETADHTERVPIVAKSAAPAKGADGAGPANANRGQARASETIRVAVDAIERMMQLVSELVLTRNQLLELTRQRADDAVKTPLQKLSSLTTDLQDAVMRARMQPVGRLYGNLPRLIRELATELGKKIDLVTEGADTELDRQLIEIIRDPLTHMIRNSADHGIEMPAERLAAGKPETGEVRVAASHEAGQITITISDDGRGLDVEKLKKKAISLGLATESEIARMADEDVFKFIFAAGFSTAKVVTNVSGRGVGMDVVRTNIESIGGSISMSSQLGRGTKFSMRIPLTLAIAPALIVEASGQRFALPQHAVVEAVGVGPTSGHKIDRVQNALVLRLREEVLPVIDINTVLGSGASKSDSQNTTEQLVVVMRVGGETFGVMVDKVADVEEIVVKPLSASLAHLKVFTGHTILGDGSVVLILDPGGLAVGIGIEKAAEKKRETKKDPAAGSDRTRLVMFRAGYGALKVLPVSVIARIEMVEPNRIETSDGKLMLVHQQRLMPILPVGNTSFDPTRTHPVLVITHGDVSIGLLVDEIIDIIEDTLDVQLASTGHDIIGSAVIRGQAVELLDVSSYLQSAPPAMQTRPTNERRQILLVHDDVFSREVLSPVLTAAGYRVVAATTAAEALALIDQGSQVDAVITNAQLPGMSGHELAEAMRKCPSVRGVPVIGLVPSESQIAMIDAETLALDLCVSQNDRQMLLASLASALRSVSRAAAPGRSPASEIAA